MLIFWWSAKQSEQKTLTKMWKNVKGPLSHWKIKCLFLDYVQFLMIGQAIQAKNVDQTIKKQKDPPKSSKNQMFILDYIQLLIISRAIWVKNVDQNAKKQKRPPKSLKNQMFIFGLLSTSDDQSSNRSKKRWPKCKKWKRPPKSSKNQMFIHFWIMFNFWWLAKQSEQKTLTKMLKNIKGPLSHWKIKCLFLDYVQFLMIGQAIQARNVNQNIKKWKRPPKSSKNKMFIFGLHSTSDDWPSNLSKKCWPKCKKMKEAP